MHELLKLLVVRMLRVPPEPHPPSGSPDSIRIFRASRNFYHYNLFRWALKQIGAVIGILVLLSINLAADAGSALPWKTIPMPEKVGKVLGEIEEKVADEDEADEDENGFVVRALAGKRSIGGIITADWFFWVEALGVLVLVVQMPITYTMVRLDYEMRWYIVTDRSLRIREGIGAVREMTMTFANVQNLAIEQGPIQRLLKISDLRVRTAGGGDADHSNEEIEKLAGSLHIGYLRGVDNAAEIRDTILDRLRRMKDSGLGDPDDRPTTIPTEPTTITSDTLAAARDLLREARALSRVLH